MKDNKRIRELVPIVALLLFIIAVLVLCVVSASVEMTSIRLFLREYAKEVGEHP